MAEPPSKAKPYDWENSTAASSELVQLWSEVGNGIDKSQQVVWKSAVDSLDQALKHLHTKEARHFVEKYAASIIGILVEQSPTKIGPHERNCVTESLLSATLITAKDLEIQIARNGECKLIETVLANIFSKRKAFYKGSKAVWQQTVNSSAGMPEVRIRIIEKFREARGFTFLADYMMQRINTPDSVQGGFPLLEALQHILTGLVDTISPNETVKQTEDDAIQVSKVVMLYLSGLSDDQLKKYAGDSLSITIKALLKIFDRLAVSRRDETVDFYRFWRELTHTLITSDSLPVKLTGWEQVNELIKAVGEHRPPPRSFVVTTAGVPFCNGEYVYAGPVTADGYAKLGSDISYVHTVPDDATDGPGKKLTLFRCTMRSKQKWWFLSEADEEQPGTDRDIDYYQHKPQEHEEPYPPPSGWLVCRNAGQSPSPTMKSVGLLVPPGQELETLEHSLAQWAIENNIVEQVLGDTTIHREVVARSTVLIKFLASMCTRDDESLMSAGKEPNKYCLQTSHLLFAWKTCLRKADAAVALQVYQLLVSILPRCPSNRSIPLLRAIQTSLNESSDKRDYLFEVSEFVSALADANLMEFNNNKGNAVAGTRLSEDVREEVLNLLWSVLIHPGVSALKTYDSLKRYVTHELKVEPKGKEHRQRFLQTCISALTKNVDKIAPNSVDELQALRMVKLTRFVLEACPKQQAEAIVTDDNGKVPLLLFNDLRVYLLRRESGVRPPLKSLTKEERQQHFMGLQERLKILRQVYGWSSTSSRIVMTAKMVKALWDICMPVVEDRELLMFFIAGASQPGKPSEYDRLEIPQQQFAVVAGGVQADLLLPAFTEDVRDSVFLDLFCSPSFQYDDLGERGYRSFQFLFKQMSDSADATPRAKGIALDALWKICLTAEKASVATQAMRDLLSVYVILEGNDRRNERAQSAEMITDDSENRFGDRVFQCLETVKRNLKSGRPSAERSVERCLRILNAAIGRVDPNGLATSGTLARLSSFSGTSASMDDVAKCLPHGMRGQGSYWRISIVVKRPQSQNQNSSNFESPRLPSTMRHSLDIHPLETLGSVKNRVATLCQCSLPSVKIMQVTGRARLHTSDPTHLNLNTSPEDTVMDELGIVEGCEMVFVIAERSMHNNSIVNASAQRPLPADLSSVFFSDNTKFVDKMFASVLEIMEALQWQEAEDMSDADVTVQASDIHKLAWDLLLSMPTNEGVASRVRSTQGHADVPSIASDDDAMEIETSGEAWSQLLDYKAFDRSVYVLLTIDAFLQPAPEVLSVFPADQRQALEKTLADQASRFRTAFIAAGGFNAVARFFSMSGSDEKASQVKTRRGNAVALRILKSCLFGNTKEERDDSAQVSPDDAGIRLLQSVSDPTGLLKSLTAMVVEDRGISAATITDVLRFLRLLFRDSRASKSFSTLPEAKKFLVILLLWDESVGGIRATSSISSSSHVRKTTHDLIIQTSSLADRALPWLIEAINTVDITSESTVEFFDALEKLVNLSSRDTARTVAPSDNALKALAQIVSQKLVTCPQPGAENDVIDVSTGVLCGCLKLLRALIENGGSGFLRSGTKILLNELQINRWSDMGRASRGGVFSLVSAQFSPRSHAEDVALVDLMGAIFDGFLTPRGSSTIAICCDKESRRRGFDVVSAAAKACNGSGGYLALVQRINGLVSVAAPKLRHRWGQFGGSNDPHSRNRMSKYSGLRNQGCTCYMNSVLQQIFMMPDLRKSMCSAPLPSDLRSVGSGVATKGDELVGKRITLQWDTGASFEAMVESYDKETTMHTIRYCPIQVANVAGSQHQQIHPEEISRLPPLMPEEFVLSEGRPGKETGVFEVVPEAMEVDSPDAADGGTSKNKDIKENEDESMSRHLLEEVQRTFIHLEEGSRGHHFDPRALVEACACLKLEFDVWQQNDASEFATKLLDRLEISLKKWAPEHFHHMDHTFGLKTTKQKICRKCGMKTNREEKLLNIDCQIRGKSDIHEALSAMTEVEIMEGSNQVFCEKCKENTDTILKSAISTFPNMLILSLKRFDLDYTTFETVKLNSRCAFGQTLSMKKYSLEAVEALERAHVDSNDDPNSMETEDSPIGNGENDPLASLPDEEYEYRLAGVLVHAGVAQGGHYYSFIKDRISGEDKWFRFDDEDVTPFDPALIEAECFGGKVKKETKWPNGHVQVSEQEQFANALMLFYEKVKPNDIPTDAVANHASARLPLSVPTLTGYDVFKSDVRHANETHQWQSFLFDTEFHVFMKGLLGSCCLSKHDRGESEDDPWCEAVVEMLLSFVFDVMMYSSDCVNKLPEWSQMLEKVLLTETASAVSFTQKLARKTKTVSGNWLRSYVIECPDQAVRSAAVRVFVAAIKTISGTDSEAKALQVWIRAWRDQIIELQSQVTRSPGPKVFAIPSLLQGSRKIHEDASRVGSGVSSVGIVLSFTNAMLDVIPRYWRFSAELCIFVRQLASLSTAKGEGALRRAMVDAQTPIRLIALIARERPPSYLRHTCPGACVTIEVANTQMRPESSPNVNVMQLSNTQVLNATDMNNPRGPTANDYVTMLEALSLLAGIPGMLSAPLVRETDEMGRGRQWYALTDEATKALSVIFKESCAPGAPGMGQREIEMYLVRCGVDSGGVSTQKILDMLSKYPTTGGGELDRGSYLSLDGFLTYYRDCIQTNDIRLKMDLHTMGFRPDLSRRSHDARFYKIGGERESNRPPVQSVAVDVAELFKERGLELGLQARFALLNSVQLYSVAYDVSEPLMHYLIAAAVYKRRDGENLIDRTLTEIYCASNDWEGNKTVSCATSMLGVIASTPGDDQQSRINRIMSSNAKPMRNVDFGGGLLVVLRSLHRLRQQQGQHYNNELHWTFNRYMHVLKEIYSLYPVFQWMNDNQSSWSFVERELLDSRGIGQQNQVRVEYGPREESTPNPLEPTNAHSDSDMNDMNDSDEDDADSQFDIGGGLVTTGVGPHHVELSGAGAPEVNGIYRQDGELEGAYCFVSDGDYKGKREKFYIFLCNVSNNTKHWYISVVPFGGNPGTSADIDFYTAPMNESCMTLPPKQGWVKAHEGRDPLPRLSFKTSSMEENNSRSLV